jgi:hypothetical protein
MEDGITPTGRRSSIHKAKFAYGLGLEDVSNVIPKITQVTNGMIYITEQ